MKRGTTIFARAVIYLVMFLTLAVCFILLPELAREEAVGKVTNPYVTFAFFAVAYTVATPFFVALLQALKLLTYIDRNKAFSTESIKVLQNIKTCAVVFGVLIILAVIGGISFARIMDPREDVTFMVTFGTIFLFVSGIIAVFVAVLQRLLIDAVNMKSENDLIV